MIFSRTDFRKEPQVALLGGLAVGPVRLAVQVQAPVALRRLVPQPANRDLADAASPSRTRARDAVYGSMKP
jgi:hypothetical protein